MVDQVRQRLLDGALRSHVDGLHRQLSRVLAVCPLIDFCNHCLDLLLGQKTMRSHEADYQVTLLSVLKAQVSQLVRELPLAIIVIQGGPVLEHTDDYSRSALLLFEEEVALHPLKILVHDLCPDSSQRRLLWQVQGA